MLCGLPGGQQKEKKMKRLFILLCLVFSFSNIVAEEIDLDIGREEKVRYQLFPTQNTWTFLKLDTMTGQIWQVQFSIQGEEYRFESELNTVDITEILEQDKKIGRYTLYPTRNTYTFILLDQIEGFTYQVQWNQDPENRFVIPISY